MLIKMGGNKGRKDKQTEEGKKKGQREEERKERERTGLKVLPRVNMVEVL
jgi:hypothetical protein